MRIIFLNTWNGKMHDAISAFIVSEASQTDVFCLQEVGAEMTELCARYLPDFQSFRAEKNVDHYTEHNAIYSRKGTEIKNQRVLLEDEKECGLPITAHIVGANSSVHIGNVHGCTFPGDKLDTPTRLMQSRKIIEYFNTLTGPRIIGGDFNLSFDTESVRLFERAGYRNLIKEFGIATTRNKLCWDRWPPETKQYYADFAFVSPEVKVSSFAVPQNEISDHLPLVLEIE